MTQARLDSLDLDESVQRWQRTLSGESMPESATYVAVLDGNVASFAIGGPYRPQEAMLAEDTASWGELYAIYTDPELTGRGAGTAAHDALLEDLSGRGYEEAALWMLAANDRSRRWYAARGWRPDGATNDWVTYGVAHPEIRLRRSLAVAPTARPWSRLAE